MEKITTAEPNLVPMNSDRAVPVRRADALDALRGLAILGMVFSGVIPFGGALPAWMYHAQVPPPEHTFNPEVPGMTWVDLVFPMFLFSLGAAIPLAQSRRLARGWSHWQVVLSTLKRGILLGTFAIFVQHVRPHVLGTELGNTRWWIALAGFWILFLMYVQLPKSFSSWLRYGATAAGWLAGVVLLASLRYPDGSGFSLDRSDIILVVLANIAIAATLIWLVSRSRWELRLGIMAVTFALLLTFGESNWLTRFLSASPIPWILHFAYWKYLLIAIPGTLVGDELVRWLQVSHLEEEEATWQRWRYSAIAGLMLVYPLVLLVGFQARWLWQTTLTCIGLGWVGWGLMRFPASSTEKLLQRLYTWGSYWLILGLALEPYQGGVKKDPATYSYFFLTAAASIFFLLFFFVAIAYFQQRRWLQLFSDCGQNPMVAYIGIANLILPLLALSGWKEQIDNMTQTPWQGVARAVVYTLLLAAIASGFTRLQLFWKT